MVIRSLLAYLLVVIITATKAQDTFSIVAADTITGEVGSAGASCVDLFAAGFSDIGFLGDLFPGVGAINTQAAYLPLNQENARARMLAGDTPDQIVAWLQANDAQGVADANNRQYGVVRMMGTGSQAAAHTGGMCLSHANHRVGAHYSIQGNILLGPEILDQMEADFLSTSGTLAQKLMAALQGANVVGADTRCADNNTSSLFAFLKVSGPEDPEGAPYISLGVRLSDGTGIEPIDSLQNLFNASVGIGEGMSGKSASVFPDPARTEVTIQLPDGVSSAGKLCLFDRSGRAVPVHAAHMHRAIRLDIAQLSPGLYHLVWVVQGGVGLRARFVKE